MGATGWLLPVLTLLLGHRFPSPVFLSPSSVRKDYQTLAKLLLLGNSIASLECTALLQGPPGVHVSGTGTVL